MGLLDIDIERRSLYILWFTKERLDELCISDSNGLLNDFIGDLLKMGVSDVVKLV